MSLGAGPGRIAGRYESLRQIGRGAIASVYLARQIDLDRPVALKEFDPVSSDDPEVLATRFVREARLASSLSHANIVTVLDYFEHEGRPYIAMEYVEGGTLRDHLRGISLVQALGVLDGVLAALVHAESRGIVHRDIKPDNILVTEEGQVKVADFGIAKAFSVVTGGILTAPGSSVGTPVYMAPEQATGGAVGVGVDLYAVGVVAFEMLVGRVPFSSSENALAVLWQHVNTPVPDIRALRPDLDPGICLWVTRLLAKQPEDRPGSAAECRDALEELALGLLGSRWRRDAPLGGSGPGATTRLPARAEPAPQPAEGDAHPFAGRYVHPIVAEPLVPVPYEHDGPVIDEHPSPAVDAYAYVQADIAEVDDLAPTARAEPVAPFRLPQPAAPRASARPGAAQMAAVGAATLIAAAAGFALFGGDDAPPERMSTTVPAQVTTAQRFAARTEQVFQKLDEARVRGRKLLAQATTPRGQASIARDIGAAYSSAATGMDELTPAAHQIAPAALVSDKLARASRTYDELADAADEHRRADYTTRRSAVAVREEAVRRAAGVLASAR